MSKISTDIKNLLDSLGFGEEAIDSPKLSDGRDALSLSYPELYKVLCGTDNLTRDQQTALSAIITLTIAGIAKEDPDGFTKLIASLQKDFATEVGEYLRENGITVTIYPGELEKTIFSIPEEQQDKTLRLVIKYAVDQADVDEIEALVDALGEIRR